MDLQLRNKTAVVTGASMGIGRAIARMLAAEGVRVAAVARRVELMEAMADEAVAAGGPRPVLIRQDMMAEDAAASIRDAAAKALGPIDILVNNAGGSRTLPIDAPEEKWVEAMTLNFTRQRQLAHALLPAMIERRWGRIINVTGKSEPEHLNAAFAAKAAVHAWAKGLSREVGQYGITVNSIPPGRIMSEQIRRNYPEDYRKTFAETEIPVRYWGEPEDLAVMAVWLASPLARYITGTVIPVDEEACVATSSDLTEARALADAEQWDEAAALCRTMLARDVGDPSALHLLGVVLLRQGNPAEAVPLLAAVAEKYQDSNVLHALGEACLALGLRDEAEARFLAATLAQPVRPEAWLSLGNMSLERDDPAEAERCFREALALRPDFVEALNNLGNALVAQLRLQEAWESYERALALRPDSANTGFAHALALLLGGDFAAGWRRFEARREAGPLRWNYQRRPALQQWQPGMVLEGKRVLLMAEQGAGDIIQFVRYAPLLAARGTEVVLELPREMHAVFADLPGVGRMIALEDPNPDCDLACPLLSLPRYFATVSDTIPQAVPYAAVPPVRKEPWHVWLGPPPGRGGSCGVGGQGGVVEPGGLDRSGGPSGPGRWARAGRQRRIGLVCSGRPEHPHDRNRSIPLARLAPVLAAPDCDFVLVQQQLRDRDQAALAATPSLRWPGARIRDFADTAALLAGLDLLISVDTSVAHLAGALARPVWTLLPYAPDYRWLLGRGDSPWYPTMRLYRQPSRGDWDAVIAAVRRDLDGQR